MDSIQFISGGYPAADNVAAVIAKITGILACGAAAYLWTGSSADITLAGLSWRTIRIISKLQLCSTGMLRNARCIILRALCCDYQTLPKNRLFLVREGKETEINETDDISAIPHDMVIHEQHTMLSEGEDRVLYARCDSPSTETTLEPAHGIFMAVTVVFEGRTYEMKDMASLCVIGTRIFDRVHLQWYMMRFHGIEILDEPYELNILTSGFEQLTILPADYVLVARAGFIVHGRSRPPKAYGTDGAGLTIDTHQCEEPHVWRNLTEADIAGTESHVSGSTSSDSSYDMMEEVS